MEEVIKQIISEYGWALITLFILLLVKNSLGNLISGITFIMGKDFNKDDIIYIRGKKTRLVRQTPFKTIFYVIGSNRKIIISNKKLYFLELEKEMSHNGDQENLDNESETTKLFDDE